MSFVLGSVYFAAKMLTAMA